MHAGEVVVLGPGPIAGSFTPDAAEATGRELLRMAEAARNWVDPDRGRA